MGILDQLCSANTMLRYPKLYAHRSFHFDVGVFWVWIVNALFHSVLLFWLPMYAVKNDIIWKNGKEGGYLVLGNMVYTVMLVVLLISVVFLLSFKSSISGESLTGHAFILSVTNHSSLSVICVFTSVVRQMQGKKATNLLKKKTINNPN